MPRKSLGDAVAEDLKRMTSSEEMRGVYEDTAFTTETSIERTNESALNPDGSARTPLSPMYAKEKSEKGLQTRPDFYFSGKAERTLDYDITDDGVEFKYGNAEVDDYMYDHEFGEDGMPRRRQFATEQDQGSGEQKRVKAEVETVLFQHLNKDRTIKVS